MASLIVRNLSEDLVKRLRVRAALNGRSGEEEHRRILEAALAADDPAERQRRREAAFARADAFRAKLAATGRTFPDVTQLIREDRDER